jgi:hypothetical protein
MLTDFERHRVEVALYRGSTAVRKNGLVKYYYGIFGKELKKGMANLSGKPMS